MTATLTGREYAIPKMTLSVQTRENVANLKDDTAGIGRIRSRNVTDNELLIEVGCGVSDLDAMKHGDGYSYKEIITDVHDRCGEIRELTAGIENILIQDGLILEKIPDLTRYPALDALSMDYVGTVWTKHGNPDRRTKPINARLTNPSTIAKTVAQTHLGVRIGGKLAQHKFRSTTRGDFIAGVSNGNIVGYTTLGPGGVEALQTAMIGDRRRNFDRDLLVPHTFKMVWDGTTSPIPAWRMKFHGGYII